MRQAAHQIPQVSGKSLTDDGSGNLFLNLNNFRFLDMEINDYQFSHRRILPSIDIVFEDRTTGYAYPRMEGHEIVYTNKRNQTLRLGYK